MSAPDAALQMARHARAGCAFYRELYQALPNDFEWDQVPAVRSEAYWERKVREPAACMSAVHREGYVWSTGGSTSTGKRVHIGFGEAAAEYRVFASALERLGVRAADRVANLFSAGNLTASFLLLDGALRLLPVVELPILYSETPELAVDLLFELSPDVVLGLPSFIVQLADLMHRQGRTLPVRLVGYAGDMVFAKERRWVSTAFGGARLSSLGYAAVDVGPIASIAPGDEDQVYLPLTDHMWVEILDEQGREPPVGQAGSLAFTNLSRKLTPVVRYVPGDQGVWLDPPGGVERRFRLLGRLGGSLKVGGYLVWKQDVERELAAVPGLLQTLQLVAQASEGRHTLVVRVAAEPGAPNPEQAVAALEAALLRRHPFLRREATILEPGMRVEVVDLARFERSPISGKLIPIIDARAREAGGSS